MSKIIEALKEIISHEAELLTEIKRLNKVNKELKQSLKGLLNNLTSDNIEEFEIKAKSVLEKMEA